MHKTLEVQQGYFLGYTVRLAYDLKKGDQHSMIFESVRKVDTNRMAKA